MSALRGMGLVMVGGADTAGVHVGDKCINMGCWKLTFIVFVAVLPPVQVEDLGLWQCSLPPILLDRVASFLCPSLGREQVVLLCQTLRVMPWVQQ